MSSKEAYEHVKNQGGDTGFSRFNAAETLAQEGVRAYIAPKTEDKHSALIKEHEAKAKETSGDEQDAHDAAAKAHRIARFGIGDDDYEARADEAEKASKDANEAKTETSEEYARRLNQEVEQRGGPTIESRLAAKIIVAGTATEVKAARETAEQSYADGKITKKQLMDLLNRGLSKVDQLTAKTETPKSSFADVKEKAEAKANPENPQGIPMTRGDNLPEGDRRKPKPFTVGGVPLGADTTYHDSIDIDDYPYGKKRTKVTFSVEGKGAKQRPVFQSINPNTGKPNAPKKGTYGRAVKFMQHEGRTYAVIDAGTHIKVARYAGGKFVDAQSNSALFPDREAGTSRDRGHDPGYVELHTALHGEPPEHPAEKQQKADERQAERQAADKVREDKYQAAKKRREDVGVSTGASMREVERREKLMSEGKTVAQIESDDQAAKDQAGVDVQAAKDKAQTEAEAGAQMTVGGHTNAEDHHKDHGHLVDAGLMTPDKKKKYVDGATKGSFKVASSRDGDGNLVQSDVKGVIVGQYGVHHIGGGDFNVTHIPSGLGHTRQPLSAGQAVNLAQAWNAQTPKHGAKVPPGEQMSADQQGEMGEIHKEVRDGQHPTHAINPSNLAVRELLGAAALTKDEKEAAKNAKQAQGLDKAHADLAAVRGTKTGKFDDNYTEQAQASGGSADVITSKAHKRAEAFVHLDQSRPNITQVQHTEGMSIATDGHRLAMIPNDHKGEDFLAPGPYMVKEHKKDVERNPEYRAILEKEQGHAEWNVKHPDRDALYPDTSVVIPKSFETATTVQASHLEAMAKLAQAAAKVDPGARSLDGKGVVTLTRKQTDKGHEMHLSHKGASDAVSLKSGEEKYSSVKGEQTIHLSAKYILDAMKGHGDQHVNIGTNKDYTPVSFKREDGEHHIIMPMRE